MDPQIQIRIRIHTKMSWIRNTLVMCLVFCPALWSCHLACTLSCLPSPGLLCTFSCPVFCTVFPGTPLLSFCVRCAVLRLSFLEFTFVTYDLMEWSVLWTRIGFSADPDPAFEFSADPDPQHRFIKVEIYALAYSRIFCKFLCNTLYSFLALEHLRISYELEGLHMWPAAFPCLPPVCPPPSPLAPPSAPPPCGLQN
jgi:hypothetical protein